MAIRTGIAFFGTPHEGGDERLVALGAAAARIASALHVQPSNDLIETLKKGSLFSDILAEQWRHHLESYQLVSFWEGIGDVGLNTDSLGNELISARSSRRIVPLSACLAVERTLSGWRHPTVTYVVSMNMTRITLSLS